jgi:hypothetical protein
MNKCGRTCGSEVSDASRAPGSARFRAQRALTPYRAICTAPPYGCRLPDWWSFGVVTTVAGIRPVVNHILPQFNSRFMGLNFSQSSLSSTYTRSMDRSVAHILTHTSSGFLGWHIIRPYSTTSLNSHHRPDRLCLSPPRHEPSQLLSFSAHS